MEWLTALIGAMVGMLIGVVLMWRQRHSAAAVARRLMEQSQAQRIDELDRIVAQLKDSFAALSRAALADNSEEFLKLARTSLAEQTSRGEEKLESRKKLIDAALDAVKAKMTEVGTSLQEIEKQRRESYGGLVKHMQGVAHATATLQETTEQLRHALASPQARGHWGERMAEDVLRMAGMVEGVNYTKQAQGAEGTRPDFTFPLPGGLRVNMDVKFPGSNYLAYLNASEEGLAESCKKVFLRDVRNRIKEVTKREYIDPSDGTLDYVLVFIPNEHIYGFVQANDPTLIDDALRAKVVLCSPLTLYAVLSVIRQSVENFQLERASNEILQLLLDFRKQWDRYLETVDRMGRRLEEAMKAYHEMTTTRAHQLDRQLSRVEDLRARRSVALPDYVSGPAPDGPGGGGRS
jgi:DNA recombination protein RmuC